MKRLPAESTARLEMNPHCALLAGPPSPTLLPGSRLVSGCPVAIIVTTPAGENWRIESEQFSSSTQIAPATKTSPERSTVKAETKPYSGDLAMQGIAVLIVPS